MDERIGQVAELLEQALDMLFEMSDGEPRGKRGSSSSPQPAPRGKRASGYEPAPNRNPMPATYDEDRELGIKARILASLANGQRSMREIYEFIPDETETKVRNTMLALRRAGVVRVSGMRKKAKYERIESAILGSDAPDPEFRR